MRVLFFIFFYFSCIQKQVTDVFVDKKIPYKGLKIRLFKIILKKVTNLFGG